MHSLDIIRVVGIAEETPFRKGDGLAAGGGEVGLLLEPVRLVDIVVERIRLTLVVAVGADDVHHVVTRVAERPGNGVAAPGRGEVETERGARDGAHDADDPPPQRLPRGRIRAAAAAVGLAVHLPAGNEDRVPGAGRDEPRGERPEMVVEGARGAAAQQRGQHVAGQPRLVGDDHRHVDHQRPARIGLPPPAPRIDDLGRALDAVPVVARQIGVPDGDRGAEPPLEMLHPFHAFGAGTQKSPQGNILRRPVRRLRLDPGHQSGRGERQQSRRCGQNGRERAEWQRPFSCVSGRPLR